YWTLMTPAPMTPTPMGPVVVVRFMCFSFSVRLKSSQCLQGLPDSVQHVPGVVIELDDAVLEPRCGLEDRGHVHLPLPQRPLLRCLAVQGAVLEVGELDALSEGAQQLRGVVPADGHPEGVHLEHDAGV